MGMTYQIPPFAAKLKEQERELLAKDGATSRVERDGEKIKKRGPPVPEVKACIRSV